MMAGVGQGSGVARVGNGGGVVHGGGDLSVDGGSDLDSVTNGFPSDDSVESVVLVGGVVDGTTETVSVNKGVATLDIVSVTGLVLALDVSGVLIMDVISEVVLGGCLGLQQDGGGVYSVGGVYGRGGVCGVHSGGGVGGISHRGGHRGVRV